MKGQDAKGYIAVKKVFLMQLTAMPVVGQPEYWEKQMNSLSKKQGRDKGGVVVCVQYTVYTVHTDLSCDTDSHGKYSLSTIGSFIE